MGDGASHEWFCPTCGRLAQPTPGGCTHCAAEVPGGDGATREIDGGRSEPAEPAQAHGEEVSSPTTGAVARVLDYATRYERDADFDEQDDRRRTPFRGGKKWKRDRKFGMPERFWDWWHRKRKQDRDLATWEEAEEMLREWKALGEPSGD